MPNMVSLSIITNFEFNLWRWLSSKQQGSLSGMIIYRRYLFQCMVQSLLRFETPPHPTSPKIGQLNAGLQCECVFTAVIVNIMFTSVRLHFPPFEKYAKQPVVMWYEFFWLHNSASDNLNLTSVAGSFGKRKREKKQ